MQNYTRMRADSRASAVQEKLDHQIALVRLTVVSVEAWDGCPWVEFKDQQWELLANDRGGQL